jgi:hypothetical protein
MLSNFWMIESMAWYIYINQNFLEAFEISKQWLISISLDGSTMGSDITEICTRIRYYRSAYLSKIVYHKSMYQEIRLCVQERTSAVQIPGGL